MIHHVGDKCAQEKVDGHLKMEAAAGGNLSIAHGHMVSMIRLTYAHG